MRRAGFTLAELLISVAIMAILSVYLTGMLTQQDKAYTVVDQVTEVQSNTRAVAGLLEREVRSTAMLAPEAAAVCGVDRTDGPDTLFVTNADAYTFSSSSVIRDDIGGVILSGFAGTGTSETLHLDRLTPDYVGYYDLDADGTPDSDFKEGDAVIVVDRKNPARGSACGVIIPGGVDLGNKTISVDFTAGAGPLGAGVNAELVAVPAHRYAVNVDHELRRDGVLLAENVEDLQIAYYFDKDGDGAIEAGETPGAVGEDQYEPDKWDNAQLREVRINFVMRAPRPDTQLPNAVFQATENREPVNGTDGYRRRVVTSTVRLRNVGHRMTS